MDKYFLKYKISYCKEENYQNLKKKFLKKGFFPIPFLKSHNSVSFLVDYHTVHSSMYIKWHLLLDNLPYNEKIIFFLGKNTSD